MTRPFSTEDFVRRLTRASRQAADAGLTGLLVTPGPDLLYLTGYAPIAITERITMLAIQAGRAHLDQLVRRERAVDLGDHLVGHALGADHHHRLEVVRARLERLAFRGVHGR